MKQTPAREREHFQVYRYEHGLSCLIPNDVANRRTWVCANLWVYLTCDGAAVDIDITDGEGVREAIGECTDGDATGDLVNSVSQPVGEGDGEGAKVDDVLKQPHSTTMVKAASLELPSAPPERIHRKRSTESEFNVLSDMF